MNIPYLKSKLASFSQKESQYILGQDSFFSLLLGYLPLEEHYFRSLKGVLSRVEMKAFKILNTLSNIINLLKWKVESWLIFPFFFLLERKVANIYDNEAKTKGRKEAFFCHIGFRTVISRLLNTRVSQVFQTKLSTCHKMHNWMLINVY